MSLEVAQLGPSSNVRSYAAIGEKWTLNPPDPSLPIHEYTTYAVSCPFIAIVWAFVALRNLLGLAFLFVVCSFT
jgi:hypothetical protein